MTTGATELIIEKISAYLEMDTTFPSILNPANDLLRHSRAKLLEQEEHIRNLQQEIKLIQNLLFGHTTNYEKTVTLREEW